MIKELVIDENGNHSYREIATHNWDGFRNAFAVDMDWINYAIKNSFLASRLETLVLIANPDEFVINEMLQLMFNISQPTTQQKKHWQQIADDNNIAITF